jgi:hypothetical protein
MIPRDFYHHPLTVGLFFKLFLFGLLAALLCVPLASAMHAFGHGFFGMAAGCTWIGVHLPFGAHTQALVDFPSPKFAGQSGFWWLQQGGFLWTGILLLAVLFFPSADELLQNLFLQVAGFHLAFWGFFKEAVVLWPAGEPGSGPPPTGPDWHFWVPAGVGLFFSALFAARTVRVLGQGLHFTLFTPLFLTLALWFLPSTAFLALLFVDGAPPVTLMGLGGAALAFLLLSPLLHPGPRLWREPAFSRWLYGLALAGGVTTAAAVVVLGWGRGSEPLLWGTIAPSATRTTGVTR